MKIMRFKRFYHILTLVFLAWILSSEIGKTAPNGLQENLEWGIKTSKKEFYSGEPVLLTLNIKNTGKQEIAVGFGAHGIEAFSMEIRDSNGSVVSKGGKIRRGGTFSYSDIFVDPNITEPNKLAKKTIVLNRWCSTLLAPGRYKVICNMEYWLNTEKIPGIDLIIYKLGSSHKIQLDLNIRIIKTDKGKFKKFIEEISEKANEAVEPGMKNYTKERFAERDLAREMLVFTESEFAVSYQLRLLRLRLGDWDIANTLGKSGTLEAAKGLIQIMEEVDKPDVKYTNKQTLIWTITDAVYKLRETKKLEIIEATKKFAEKYKPIGIPYFEVD